MHELHGIVPLKFGVSAEALVAIDEQGSIVFWNDAATKLLGRDAAQAVGRPCHEVLRGLTAAGGHLCGPNCPIQASCRELRAPRRFEMVVPHPDGAELWLEATTCIVLDDEDRPIAIHILSEAVSARRLADLAETVVRRVSKLEASVPATRSGQIVTRRELDVLSLLAEGLGTGDIAARLSLSIATVRNHVQNLLLKLGAHSRAEAVVIAVKSGLVQLH
jgi:PAS domain S-box-containing protein